jgi:hypothetical protein
MSKWITVITAIVLSVMVFSMTAGQVTPVLAGFTPTPRPAPTIQPPTAPPPQKVPKDTPTPTPTISLIATPFALPVTGGQTDGPAETGSALFVAAAVLVLIGAGVTASRSARLKRRQDE